MILFYVLPAMIDGCQVLLFFFNFCNFMSEDINVLP